MSAVEQVAWATGTAVFVAFFTTVVAQYLFAPTLEARKQRILNRSAATAEAVRTIREMYFQLDLLGMKRFRLKDMYGFDNHTNRFSELSDKFDAALALNDSGLKPKYVELALSTQFAAEIFSMRSNPSSDHFDPVLRLFKHCIGALDPVNLPTTRAYHCWKGRRVSKRMVLPPIENDLEGMEKPIGK